MPEQGELAFKELFQFARTAAEQVGKIDDTFFAAAIGWGERQIKPGIELDDALEIEQALRDIRALRKYRQAIEPASNQPPTEVSNGSRN